MGRAQRNKGKTWEREVAAVFRAMFGEQVRRGWQAREGHDAADVEGVERFRIEAKHHKVVNIAEAIRQSLADRAKAKDRRWALVVSKSDRAVPLATMPFTEFMQLLKEWRDAVDARDDSGGATSTSPAPVASSPCATDAVENGAVSVCSLTGCRRERGHTGEHEFS